MTRNGQILHNPVTGERVKWHLTSAETGGRLVRAEWWARTGGGVTFEHVHREAEERFEVLAGRLAAELGGRRVDLGPGERIALPAGIPHRWWNAGPDDLHFVVEIEPPGHFVETVETLFGLAPRGERQAGRLAGPASARRHGPGLRLRGLPDLAAATAAPRGCRSPGPGGQGAGPPPHLSALRHGRGRNVPMRSGLRPHDDGPLRPEDRHPYDDTKENP